MFWGLVLQPGKKYTSTVKDSFHLSTVTVDTKSVGKNENGIFPVQVEVDGQELIICNLSNQCLQMNVDLFFDKGLQLTFMTTGKAAVHLTGYTMDNDTDEYSNESSESSESSESESDGNISKSQKKKHGSDKQNSSKKGSHEKRKLDSSQAVAVKKAKIEKDDSSEEEEDSELDEFDDSDLGDFSLSDDNDVNDDEIEGDSNDEDDDEVNDMTNDSGSDDANNFAKKKKKKSTQHEPKSDKKSPAPNQKQDKVPGSNKKFSDKLNKSQTQPLSNGAPVKGTPGKTQGTPGKMEKKEKKKSLSQAEAKTPKANESVSSPSQSPKKQTMEGGVIIEDLKSGNGPVAKPGKLVSVYYTGRLKNNNRVFDQTNSGAGFKFRLGRGEVIKGWDVALNGMKVGSKRRITLPPAMGYGTKGSPPQIPPNSSLVFDVELRSVK